MTRWILLILIPVAIIFGIRNEAINIEQRLHGKVVLALADEDLSEVRVQMDGRKVLLSGPEDLLPQASTVVRELVGVQLIETKNSMGEVVDLLISESKASESKSSPETNYDVFKQVTHPEQPYWPIKGIGEEHFFREASQPSAEHLTIDGASIDSYLAKNRKQAFNQVEHPEGVDGPVPSIGDFSTETNLSALERSNPSSFSSSTIEHTIVDGAVIDDFQVQIKKPSFIQVTHPEAIVFPVEKTSTVSTDPDSIVIEHEVINREAYDIYQSELEASLFVQVNHPEGVYWPVKESDRSKYLDVNATKKIIDHSFGIVDGSAIETYQMEKEAFVQVKHPEQIDIPINKESMDAYPAVIIQPFIEVTHPNELYWPRKKVDLLPIDGYFESTLLITKLQRNVEVYGAVPKCRMRKTIHSKLEQFVDVPAYLFDLTLDKQRSVPDWYKKDLPLLIPFFQWVDEGQLRYMGNRILLMGVVKNQRAIKVIEVAISNITPHFQVENRLRMEAN